MNLKAIRRGQDPKKTVYQIEKEKKEQQGIYELGHIEVLPQQDHSDTTKLRVSLLEQRIEDFEDLFEKALEDLKLGLKAEESKTRPPLPPLPQEEVDLEPINKTLKELSQSLSTLKNGLTTLKGRVTKLENAAKKKPTKKSQDKKVKEKEA